MQTSTSTARGSIPLTEDGYAVLEPECCMEDINQAECFNQYHDGKTNVTISDHFEVNGIVRNECAHDYEEPYWEPANKEEALLDQLSKLGVPVILAQSIE